MKKFIYTLWTKPWIRSNSLYLNFVCFLLSLELVKKQSNNIIIYTDNYGKEILNKLDLNVEINTSILHDLEMHYLRWSIPKLYVINSQKEPCCHIDHDVFLWGKMPDLNGDITVQNLEKSNFYASFYKRSFMRYIINNNNINDDLLKEASGEDFAGYNCGYLDIKNIDASKKWTDFAIEIDNNFQNGFEWIDCTLIEQYSLYYLSNKLNLKISKLFGNGRYDVLQNQEYLNYTHLMSEKFNPLMSEKIENKLLETNDLLYNKLYRIFKNE
jgi:hypothetical protein